MSAPTRHPYERSDLSRPAPNCRGWRGTLRIRGRPGRAEAKTGQRCRTSPAAAVRPLPRRERAAGGGGGGRTRHAQGGGVRRQVPRDDAPPGRTRRAARLSAKEFSGFRIRIGDLVRTPCEDDPRPGPEARHARYPLPRRRDPRPPDPRGRSPPPRSKTSPATSTGATPASSPCTGWAGRTPGWKNSATAPRLRPGTRRRRSRSRSRPRSAPPSGRNPLRNRRPTASCRPRPAPATSGGSVSTT